MRLVDREVLEHQDHVVLMASPVQPELRADPETLVLQDQMASQAALDKRVNLVPLEDLVDLALVETLDHQVTQASLDPWVLLVLWEWLDLQDHVETTAILVTMELLDVLDQQDQLVLVHLVPPVPQDPQATEVEAAKPVV